MKVLPYFLILGAFLTGRVEASPIKGWPLPVWALATTCDEELNCWKIASQVPDVILRHSESIAACTAWMNKLTGGTQMDDTGKVFHVIISCAVSPVAPQGYTVKK